MKIAVQYRYMYAFVTGNIRFNDDVIIVDVPHISPDKLKPAFTEYGGLPHQVVSNGIFQDVTTGFFWQLNMQDAPLDRRLYPFLASKDLASWQYQNPHYNTANTVLGPKGFKTIREDTLGGILEQMSAIASYTRLGAAWGNKMIPGSL